MPAVAVTGALRRIAAPMHTLFAPDTAARNPWKLLQRLLPFSFAARCRLDHGSCRLPSLECGVEPVCVVAADEV